MATPTAAGPPPGAAGPPPGFPTDAGLPPIPTLTPEQFAALPHDSDASRFVISAFVLITVSAIVLGLRIYCKFLKHNRLWWDDYILIAAWVCVTVEASCLTAAIPSGFGLHIWDAPLDKTSDLIIFVNVAGSFSVTAAIWSKTSFAFTMLRITEGYMKWMVWFIIISMNLAMGLSALLIWVRCTPIEKTWKPFGPGTCWDMKILVNYDIFSAAYSAAMDFALALLPWRVVWGLQMKKKERIGIAVAMSMGVVAGATAIVKTAKIPTMLSLDIQESNDLWIWGNAETTVTIIAASIPMLRVLFLQAKNSSQRYYGSSNPTGALSHPGPSNTITITAGSRRAFNSHRREDDQSDKSILEDEASPTASDGKIVQTNEVIVQYHHRRDTSSDEYEMERMA